MSVTAKSVYNYTKHILQNPVSTLEAPNARALGLEGFWASGFIGKKRASCFDAFGCRATLGRHLSEIKCF